VNELETEVLSVTTDGAAKNYDSYQDTLLLSDLLDAIPPVKKKLGRTEKYAVVGFEDVLVNGHVNGDASEDGDNNESKESSSKKAEKVPYSIEWCRLQREMGELLEKTGAALEGRRVSKIMADFRTKHPEASTDSDCAICCESVYLTGAHGMLCCGKRVCLGCTNSKFEDVKNSKSKSVEPKWTECPFCRHKSPQEQEYYALMWKLVEQNKPWGLVAASDYYHFRGDEKRALEFMRRAAEIGFALAQLHMARYYRLGSYGLEKDVDESTRWAKLAAEQGASEAAYLYSQTLKGTKAEVLKWATISAAMGYPEAQYQLGVAFEEGNLELVVSKEKALYWLRQATEIGHSGAMSRLGNLIFHFAGKRYGSEYKFADHNPLVESTYWMRRASEHGRGGKTDAMGLLNGLLEAYGKDMERNEGSWNSELASEYEKEMEAMDFLRAIGTDGIVAMVGSIQVEKVWKRRCENCGKERKDCPGGELIRCKRCNICCYCSIQCLADDWKARHNNDCIPEKRNKYNEAYTHTHF